MWWKFKGGCCVGDNGDVSCCSGGGRGGIVGSSDGSAMEKFQQHQHHMTNEHVWLVACVSIFVVIMLLFFGWFW